MRYITTPFSILLALLIFTNVSFGQSELKKANKEYDLAAYNLAIDSYLKVLQKNPKNSLAMARLADSYRYINDMDQAEKWYRKAIRLSGIDPIHVFEYANVLKAKGQYDTAKEWFDIYGEGHPEIGKHFVESCTFAKSIQDVPSLYDIQNVSINSSSSDFSPAMYNKSLIFASSRQDISRSGNIEKNWDGGSKNQLFISKVASSGSLGEIQYVHSDVRSNYNEGPVTYSADGRTVAFTKNTFVNGTRQIPGNGTELSIYIAEVTIDGDWKDAKPFPFNGSGYSSGFPHLSADGKTLYFASNRPDGFGGYDIYVSQQSGDTWSTPENMGPVINSKGNEITPFLTDNGNLIFASDWHHGLGGFDLFRAERVDGLWKNVFHLGNGINSSYDDYGYVYDDMKGRGYMVSNRPGGKGNEDIYMISKATEHLTIEVRDQSTNKPISNALVDFSACGEPVFKTDANGVYKFQALEGLNCDVTISKKGYTSASIDIGNTKPVNGVLAVVLSSQAKERDFQGKIIHAATSIDVSNVRVSAVAQSSGTTIETTSDNAGVYALPLEPNENYIIRYSKVGFSDIKKQVRTGRVVSTSALGVISMPPAGTNIVDNNPVRTGTIQGGQTSTNNTTAEVVDVVTSTTTVTVPSPPANTGVEMVGQTGYAVQISAIKMGSPMNRSKYEVMTSVGNVYARKIDGYNKIRIGIFETRAEAKAAANAAKSNGFGSAFVVTENVNNSNEIEILGQNNISSSPINTTTTTTTTTDYYGTPSTGSYKVQIGAYRDTRYFNRDKASQIGVIEERFNGDLTLILLGGYLDLSAAKSARNSAIRNGFKGAFVVYDNGSTLEKIK